MNHPKKPFDVTASRARSRLPDYHLDAVYPVCWPIYKIRLTVTVLERRGLPTTASYILRLVDNGVCEPSQLERMLGLPKKHIAGAATDLLRADLVEQNQDLQLALTGEGKNALNSIGKIVRPRTKHIVIPFDPLTRRIPDISVEKLLDTATVDNKGLFVVQYTGAKPGQRDLRLEEVRRYKDHSSAKDDVEDDIVYMSGVVSRNARLRYRGDITVVKLSHADTDGVVFLAYRNHQYLEEETSTLQLLADKGVNLVPEEFEHDLRLRGETSSASPEENALLAEIKELDLKTEEARQSVVQAKADESLQNRDDKSIRREVIQEKLQLSEKLAERENRLDKIADGAIRLIKTEEHHDLLLRAIEQATKELTLVSAWIDPHAFDGEIRKKIASAIAKGVVVRIAWGLGVNGRRTESVRNQKKGERVLGMLKKVIPRDAAKRLVTVRTDTHEKFIICDDKFCAFGSFNWLSYRGDRDRGYRRETSMYSTRTDDIRLWRDNASSLFQTASA